MAPWLWALLFAASSFAESRSDVTIEWDPIPGAAGYKVRYGRAPGVNGEYATEEYTGFGGEPKFTFLGVYAGTTYWYAVLGYGIDSTINTTFPHYVDGELSEEFNFTVDEELPVGIPAPTALTVD